MENQNGGYATGSGRENNVTAPASEFRAVFVGFLCPRVKGALRARAWSNEGEQGWQADKSSVQP